MADEPSTPPEGGQTDPPADPPPAERTFTQAEVDRIAGDRARREREKYADYDALREKASKFDEAEAANLSELQKAQQRVAELETANQQALARAQEDRLTAAVTAKAVEAKIVDPEAAVKLVDRSAITFDDSGAPQGVSEAVAALAEAKSWLVNPNQTRTPGADQGARGDGQPTQISRDQLSQMTPDQIDKARRDGLLDHIMAGGQ